MLTPRLADKTADFSATKFLTTRPKGNNEKTSNERINLRMYFLKSCFLYLKSIHRIIEIMNPGINLGCKEEAKPATRPAMIKLLIDFESSIELESLRNKAVKNIKLEAQIDSYPIEIDVKLRVGFSRIK